MPASSVPEITVQELRERMDQRENFLLLDVRQPDEYDFANLDGKLIPLTELPERLEEIDDFQHKPVVVHCRSGSRSAKAVQFLRQQGFGQAVNLKGGINAWSEQIDSSVPTY